MVVAVLFGLACIYMGLVTGGLMLLFGFTMIRMLGQGSLSLVSNYTINQWWMRRRGMVVGISGVLMALLGMGAFPNLLNWLIGLIGWRPTYMAMGLVLIFVMAPVGYLFYRSRPERYGLLPDGASTRNVGGQSQTQDFVEEEWTLSEALHTPAFWIVVSGLASISMLATGLTFHMVSIFEDSQLSADAAAAVFLPISMVSAAVNLGSGILVDRVPIRFLLVDRALHPGQCIDHGPIALQRAHGPGLRRGFGRALRHDAHPLNRDLADLLWSSLPGQHHGCDGHDHGCRLGVGAATHGRGA